MTRRFYKLGDLPQEQVRRSIGKGVEFLVKGCFPEMDSKDVPEILMKHREFYLQHPHVDGYAYPKVVETLTALRSKGMKVGVATNKPKQVAVLTLTHYLPTFQFDVVCGPEDVSQKKPAPEHLLETLKRISVPPQAAWYCGDDPVDMACAEAAKVKFLAAGWGFGGVKGPEKTHLTDFSMILKHVV